MEAKRDRMAASALCAMLLAVAGCGNTGQREGIFVTFDMPYDGKATIVIDDAESGCRVRNLVNGLRFGKGRHEVEWDGRAEDGTGAKAGRYRARIAVHRALGYDYKGSFAAGGEKMFGGFGPNHLPCEMVAPAGKRIVAAALFTEGGNSTLVLSHDGKLVNGYGDGWNLGNKACVYLPSDGEWIYSVREAEGNRLEFHGYGVERRERRHCEIENARPVELKGATKIGNRVYISNALGGALDVYELREEEWRSVLAFSGESIPCGIAGPLAESGGEPVLPFKENLVSMACDGKSLYTLERGSSLIHVYDLATKKPLRTIGEDGGSYTGPWRKNRLVDPRSLAFDSEGSLWVAEYRYNPKRITRWNVVSGECDYEKTGGEKYGSPGCGMDGEDPSRWIAHDAEWRYDPAKRIDRPLALLFDEKAGQGELFDLPPRQARTYKFARRDGKTFVIGNDGATTVWEYLEDEHRLKPLAMQGTPGFYSHMIDRRNTCVPMRDAYRRRFPGSDPERFRHDEETLMVWRDADGDERMQAEEFEFAPQGSGGTGGWGLFASDVDFSCLVNLDGEYALIDLEYPDYSLAKALAGARRLKGRVPAGSSVAARTEGFSAHDRRYIAPCLSPYMFGFERDGTLAWHMKNPFPGVHGSQAAPLPSPGELQGVLFALGSVPGGRRGEYEVVAMKNNHGRIFFITTDGLYIDELFSDCRVAAANDETCIGGESFGGSFEYDRRGGRAVLTSGGGGYRWYDILGLDSIEEKMVEFELSGRELALAQERNPAAGVEKAKQMSFAVPDSEELKHVAYWNSGDWRINLFARRNAEGRFRIGFGVEEPSPWTNNGTDRYEMFKSGDCVDFQYLDGNGEACRLMAYPPGGIVLYRHNAKGDAHVFASPWRSYTVGDVSFPENLDLRVAKGERDYRVEFDVPGDFSGDRELKCDFGVIFGDREGRVNMSRVYWSNKETGLVNDVPGEIMPEPEKWGVIRFGAGAKKVAGPVASARIVRAGPVVNPHGTVCEDDGAAYHRENYAAGPAYDRKNKLVYVSGGKGVVRALTLDGEEVSRYRLPSARAFDRFDSLVFDDRSGELFALAGGLAAQDKRKNEPDAGMLYRIRPKTGEVSLVASNLCAISGKALGGRIAAMTQDSTLDWIDLKTMARSPLSSDSVENGSVYPCMIDFLPDRTPIAFVQHNWYYLYRNGRRSEPRTVFGDREISMTRGAVIGDELWLLAGATIKRYGATDMKCAPGVVYGGASGYFLGHVEMDEGMHAVGICALDEPGTYAVASAVNSAVCVMRYDDANWRMVPLKRLGGICKPANLLVDDDGMMMADSLCWRWDSPPNSPTALTVVRMPVRASVVAKDGKTVHITETHGSRIEFRHGRLADGELAFDWNRDSLPYPEGSNPSEGQRWGEKAPVCAFEKDGVVFALSADGFVRTYAIDGEGHPAGEGYFAERRLPRPPWQGGDFSSFAPLGDGSFAVQVGGRAYRYAFGGGEWKAGERLGALDGCYVVADGGLVAVAAGAAGEVRLFADGDQFRELCRIDALAAPRRLAMRNGRLVVWEAAAQRISSYEIETESM